MKRILHDYSPWPVLIIGGAMGLGGAILLRRLLGDWPVSPEHDRRYLFLAALWLTCSGIALPILWLLHRRFGRPDAGEDWRSFGVLVRQSGWVGTWGAGCAWLQYNRTLNWAMALLLVVVFILLEALLLARRQADEEEP
ncbi:MAG: hypothetical protein KAS81_04845 [Anaerolineales bacterium]|nr:hypothetical protein [Anaerolineales bacterium]